MNSIAVCAVMIAAATTAHAQVEESLDIRQVVPGSVSADEDTVVTLLGSGFSSSAEVSVLPGGLYEAARLPTPYVAERVAIHDHFALVTDWHRCITVFDIRDPHEPSQVGLLNVSGGCLDVKTRDRYAYVSSQNREKIFVVDLDTPSAPRLVREIETGLGDGLVALGGERLYLGGSGQYGIGKIQIYSLASPEAPQLLSTYSTGSTIKGIESAGSLLYVLLRDTLAILDVTQYDDVREIGRLQTRSAEGFDLHGDHVYLARRSDGLMIVDVTDPTSPSVVAEYAPPSYIYAWDVAVNGGTAYVSGGRLTLIDVHDPTSPMLIDEIRVPSAGKGLEIVGEYAYLAAGGLVVVGVSDPVGPDFFVTGIPTVQDSYYDIAIRGDHAYAVAYNTGLLTIDIRDPLSPWIVSINGDTRRPRAVTWRDKQVFTSGWELSIFDLRRPASPALRGSEGAYLGLELAVEGDHAYLVNRQLGLAVYDISDTSDPRLIADRAHLGVAVDVDVSGDVVFVAGGSGGLFVLDVSNPRFPAVIANRRTFDIASAVVVVDHHVLVADYEGGVLTFDVSEPHNPRLVHVYETRGDATKLIVRGTTAYVSDSADGILQLDVSDPTLPIPVGRYGGECLGTSVDATETHLFRMSSELHVCQLNPSIDDVEANSSDEIQFTMSSGFVPGPYHLMVTDRLTGEASILYNAIRVAPSGPLAILPIE